MGKEFFIHAFADVATFEIGQGTKIWQFVVILEGAKIGINVNVNCHCFIEGDVIIGDNSTIKSGVYLWDGIRIGEGVFIGPNATFVNDSTPRSKEYKEKFLQTIIENKVSIGANVTILGGITIHEGAMIGAGSVLTKNVPAYQLWYGNPAQHKGFVTSEGIVLDMDYRDKRSGKSYSSNQEFRNKL